MVNNKRRDDLQLLKSRDPQELLESQNEDFDLRGLREKAKPPIYSLQLMNLWKEAFYSKSNYLRNY